MTTLKVFGTLALLLAVFAAVVYGCLAVARCSGIIDTGAVSCSQAGPWSRMYCGGPAGQARRIVVWALLLAAPCCGQERLTRWEKVPEYEPMASSFWQSADGVLNAAGSWTNGVPGAGIISVFGDLSHVDASSGMTIAAGATLISRPDYKGNIGASGSPVVHGTSTARYVIRHPGDFYWGGQAATIVTQIVIDNLGGTAYLSGSCPQHYVKNGTLAIQATHNMSGGAGTWLWIGSNQCDVTIAQKNAAEVLPLLIRMYAGKLTNARDFDSASQIFKMSGGEVIQTGMFASTMIVIVAGGVLRYEPATDPSAQAPFFFVDNGVLDVRNSQFAIPASQVEVGLGGTILGNAIEPVHDFYDLDLNEEYP
jgi:hypothetical protein